MLSQTALERLRRIQQNRHRALVYQFYFHHFLEAAGFAVQAGGANLFYEELVELARFFGRAAASKDGRLPRLASP